MIFKVFKFKSLKLVIAKISDEVYIGYSVDPKYPEYSRAIIRGSAKEVVETCIYLYKSRLLTAYNCEGYTWDIYGNYAGMPLEDSANDWVSYVLNRYLLSTFNMCYEQSYKVIDCSYVARGGTYCSLHEYIRDGITIKYW